MKRDLSAPYKAALIDGSGLEDLSHIGIKIRLPRGQAFYWPDENGELWKEVGQIRVWSDNGSIDLMPYTDIAGSELEALTGAGWEAWHHGPRGQDYWDHLVLDGRECWQCVINVEVYTTDPVARIIRAAECLRDCNDRLFGGRGHAA